MSETTYIVSTCIYTSRQPDGDRKKCEVEFVLFVFLPKFVVLGTDLRSFLNFLIIVD